MVVAMWVRRCGDGTVGEAAMLGRRYGGGKCGNCWGWVAFARALFTNHHNHRHHNCNHHHIPFFVFVVTNNNKKSERTASKRIVEVN